MNKGLYRVGIRLTPGKAVHFCPWTGDVPEGRLQQKLARILSRHRARGGALALTDGEKISVTAFGTVRKDGSLLAAPDTYFRAASVSKFVTACGILRLAEQRKLSLEEDIGAYLGFPVRNPKYPDQPITLSMLLSHTSSIRDGETYQAGLSERPPFPELLKKDCFADYAPGSRWDYSNLAAGIAGCVLEGALKKPFDDIMKETVFSPLSVSASYLPSKIVGVLSDAWRLFPPAGTPGYDAEKRQRTPAGSGEIDLTRDYLMAHGSLCIRVGDLLSVARHFVQSSLFPLMKERRASFGDRDKNLEEGLGTFLYRSPSMKEPLYGHQGLAYGAVHGLFLNGQGEGFALLTSAASEQRAGVMTRLNIELCDALFSDGRCRPW